MGTTAEPGPPAVILGGDADEPLAKPSRDFRITAAHRIGEGSLREKALANLAAIRTLKQLEAEAPVKAQLVKLRFFAGVSLEDAADMLGVSPATAKRYWAVVGNGSFVVPPVT